MACEASCVSTSGSAAGKVECDVGRLEADSDVAVGIEPESDMGGESAAHIVGIGGARSALPAKEVTCGTPVGPHRSGQSVNSFSQPASQSVQSASQSVQSARLEAPGSQRALLAAILALSVVINQSISQVWP